MLSTEAVEGVLAKFRPLIARDGGRLELVACGEGEALVRYTRGVNEQCESCILSEEDLGAMIAEALPRDAGDFRVVVAGPAPDA